ncbi:MAG TPA: acyl-CoA dehydratase activase-related protein, partial [Kofleriaceae bacterium]|nr:acyl-CoA dehydratase activase-related protein [Kofleriaceae bacterium]
GTEEKDEFLEKYRVPKFDDATLTPGSTVRVAIGLDGGSTSSKIVLVDEDGKILKKCYQLSKGNPIVDMQEMFTQARDWATSQGATIEVIGFGVTGYAGDVMQKALKADANIVETIAHMMSAVHFFGKDIDVICDIGGQDIKVLFMQQGDVKNFKLSNQCSAGNGMLLQAMADQFGIPVTEYAETAFGANLSPKFSYGCAVFLDSDRVNFQKEGYSKDELLAGLALVLPKNVWQYVVQIPRMAELGTKYVLQGGTQHNKAALKAQVDYIAQRVPGAEIFLHPHTGEAGAIGAAFEALRVVKRRGTSTFVGLDAAIDITYTSTNDENTRCNFCPNNCSRTFIDTQTPDGGTARYISGFSCEKGTVEDMDALKLLNKERSKRVKSFPNLVDFEAKLAFKSFYDLEPLPDHGTLIDDVQVKRTLLGAVRRKTIKRAFQRSSQAAVDHRKKIRIGIPKVLNIWSTAPFWRHYLEAVGIEKRNIVFSDDTSEDMWKDGGKYGSVDPCYPGKVGQAHIHNLFFKHHEKRALDYIFFPCITHIPTFVENVMDTASCPVVSGTPKVLRAAFTKETDFFAERKIGYLDPAITMDERLMMKQQLFDTFGERLQITEDENDWAVEQAWKAMKEFDRTMEEKGRAIIDEMVATDRIALLMIGRPYHNDPGLNHGVLEEFQAMGYPILSIKSIPKDLEFLNKVFADDLRKKLVESPREVTDVWPENYSVNSVQKVWAAKFASRHPNVAVLDLSSFKCGHDAPTYGMIDSIIAASGSPYSALHDIDANKPSGSIKIRTKTYGHTLMLAQERLEDARSKREQLLYSVNVKKLELLEQKKRVANGHGVHPSIEREIAELRAAVETVRAAKEAQETAQAAAPTKTKRPQQLAVVQ